MNAIRWNISEENTPHYRGRLVDRHNELDSSYWKQKYNPLTPSFALTQLFRTLFSSFVVISYLGNSTDILSLVFHTFTFSARYFIVDIVGKPSAKYPFINHRLEDLEIDDVTLTRRLRRHKRDSRRKPE